MSCTTSPPLGQKGFPMERLRSTVAVRDEDWNQKFKTPRGHWQMLKLFFVFKIHGTLEVSFEGQRSSFHLERSKLPSSTEWPGHLGGGDGVSFKAEVTNRTLPTHSPSFHLRKSKLIRFDVRSSKLRTRPPWKSMNFMFEGGNYRNM